MQAVFEKIIEKLEDKRKKVELLIMENPQDELDRIQTQTAEDFATAYKGAIEIVKQEAEQYELYDTISIHTNGLEEGIRCAVCTNQIKSDIGCDGGCCVDENLVKRICDVIHKFECKPYQPKGE